MAAPCTAASAAAGLVARPRSLRIVATAAPERPAGGGARFTPSTGSAGGKSLPSASLPTPTPTFAAQPPAPQAVTVNVNNGAASEVTIKGEVAVNGILSPPQIYEKVGGGLGTARAWGGDLLAWCRQCRRMSSWIAPLIKHKANIC
jgi:hypothetical protein